MAYTDINSEDRLVQATFAEHLELVQGPGGVRGSRIRLFARRGGLARGPHFR